MGSDEHSTPHWMSAHFGTLCQCSVYPTAPVLLTKSFWYAELARWDEPNIDLKWQSVRTAN